MSRTSPVDSKGAGIVKYSQYDPIIVTDQFNNDYICLNKYEAKAVADLIETLKSIKVEGINFDTGDWFYDVPAKINKWLKPAPRKANK